jgi:hypothetical protein
VGATFLEKNAYHTVFYTQDSGPSAACDTPVILYTQQKIGFPFCEFLQSRTFQYYINNEFGSYFSDLTAQAARHQVPLSCATLASQPHVRQECPNRVRRPEPALPVPLLSLAAN